jgi:hypothetical protein
MKRLPGRVPQSFDRDKQNDLLWTPLAHRHANLQPADERLRPPPKCHTCHPQPSQEDFPRRLERFHFRCGGIRSVESNFGTRVR